MSAFTSSLSALDQEITSVWERGLAAAQQNDLTAQGDALAKIAELQALRARMVLVSEDFARLVGTEPAVSKAPAATPKATPAKLVEIKAEEAKEPVPEEIPSEADVLPPDWFEPPRLISQRKLSPEAKQWRKRARQFHESLREFDLARPLDGPREAQLKALVCELRAVQELARMAGQDPDLHIDFDDLRDKFNAEASDPEFFGFNLGRDHKPDLWGTLAQAYQQISVAIEAAAWLREASISPDEFLSVFMPACAAEACLYRCFYDHNMLVTDGQQRHLHEDLLSLQPDGKFVPYWRTDDDRLGIEEIQKAAEPLAAIFRPLAEKVFRRDHGDRAMARLHELVEHPQVDDFEEALIATVRGVLEGGIPPTRKDLVSTLVPFRDLLGPLEHPQARRLKDSLQKDATLIAKKYGLDRAAETDASADDNNYDPNIATLVAELRPFTEGKSMVFLGGNKGQRDRGEELMRELGLKEFAWPDMEDTTNMNRLYPAVDKADIVCLLIRWSRHSYKQVLDHAKSADKVTVTFPRGYGFNTVVKELHARLVPASVAA